MKGGAYVVAGDTRPPIDIILNLMYESSVKINIISQKSRNGVVMEMIVPPVISPFRDIDDAGNEYIVVRLICKFVLVDDNDRKITGERGLYRRTVKNGELEQEYVNLSELFNISYPFLPPLCPAPLALSGFDKQFTQVLELLKTRVNPSDAKLLNLLISGISEDTTNIELMAMTHVEQDTTLETESLITMLDNCENDNEVIELMSEAYFTIARLLFIYRIINFDLHANNMLVTRIPELQKFKCTIIDMQEVSFADTFDPGLKARYYDANNDDKKIKFMQEVIDMYSKNVRIYRRIKYKLTDDHMDWLMLFSEYPDARKMILLKATRKLDSFLEQSTPRVLPPQTISFNILPPPAPPPSSSSVFPPPPGSSANKQLDSKFKSTSSKKKTGSKVEPPIPPPSSKKGSTKRGGKSKKRRTIKRRNALKR